MSRFCTSLLGYFSLLGFSEGLSTKITIVLIILATLGTKVDPAIFMQLILWSVLDLAAPFYIIIKKLVGKLEGFSLTKQVTWHSFPHWMGPAAKNQFSSWLGNLVGSSWISGVMALILWKTLWPTFILMNPFSSNIPGLQQY